MQQAYLAVKNGALTCRKAALTYGLPRSTLIGYLQSDKLPEVRNASRKRGSSSKIFTQEHEEALAQHVSEVGKFGYIYTNKQLAAVALEYGSRCNVQCPTFGQHWRTRWKMKYPQPPYPQRVEVNPESVKVYWKNIAVNMVEYSLAQKPHLVFSCCEFTGAGCKSRVLGCANAKGDALPPFVLKVGATDLEMLPEIASAIQDDDDDRLHIFRHYLEHHVLRFVRIPEGETMLLLVQGWQESVGLRDWAIEKNVAICILPAYSQQNLSPLYVGCFEHFRKDFWERCPSVPLAQRLVQAYTSAVCPDNVKEGFRLTGVIPCNPCIDSENIIPGAEVEKTVANRVKAEPV